MKRSSKMPKDANQLAAAVVRLSTENATKQPLASQVAAYLAQIGHVGGLKGGKARAKKLSAKKRTQIARHAAMIRWRQAES